MHPLMATHAFWLNMIFTRLQARIYLLIYLAVFASPPITGTPIIAFLKIRNIDDVPVPRLFGPTASCKLKGRPFVVVVVCPSVVRLSVSDVLWLNGAR